MVMSVASSIWSMASASSQEQFLSVHATRKSQSTVYRPLRISLLPRIRCGSDRTIFGELVATGNNQSAKIFVAARWRLCDILSYDTNVQLPLANPQSGRDEAKQDRMKMDRHFARVCMVFH
jgi:hypothetical protein